MTEINFALDDDLQTVALTVPTDPPVLIKLNVDQVEDILKTLGLVRLMMAPARPASDWPPGQKVEAIDDPRWVCEPDFLMGQTIMHLLDPRYGWLHYLFSPESSDQIADLMQAHADKRGEERLKGKPS